MKFKRPKCATEATKSGVCAICNKEVEKIALNVAKQKNSVHVKVAVFNQRAVMEKKKQR